MGKETTPYRVYDPKSLKAMGMAFDAALNALPHEGRGDTRLLRELALRIIYLPIVEKQIRGEFPTWLSSRS